MPNRQVHVAVGAVVGAATAAARATHWSSPDPTIEAIAGLVGGLLGATLPDYFEPALTPRHREVLHSVVAGGALAAATFKAWEVACRNQCREWERVVATHMPGCEERLRAERNALLWRLAAAFLVGLAAGYVSHLVLNAGTPNSIPVLFP